MNNQNNIPQQSNGEVSLKEIIELLGSIFDKIGNTIKNFFLFIFKVFIYLFVFIKTYFFILLIGPLLFFGTYYTYNSVKKDSYTYQMVLNPEKDVSIQLYNQINYLNSAISSNNIDVLINNFRLSKDEVKSIKRVSLEPIISYNAQMRMYFEEATELKKVAMDTTYLKRVSLEQYVSSLFDVDYKNHELTIYSSSNKIKEKILEKSFLKGLLNSELLQKNKMTSMNLITSRKNRTKEISNSIDSLIVSKTKAIREGKYQKSQGVSALLTEASSTESDIEIFDKREQISDKISDLEEAEAKIKNRINVLSNLKLISKPIAKISYIYSLMGGLLLSFIFIILLRLNRYIKDENITL